MRRTIFGILIGIAAGLLVGLAASYDSFSTWRWRVGDSLYVPNEEYVPVAIIAIDEDSLQLYGQPEEWPTDRYAALFQHAREAGARVMAFDFLLPPAAETAISEFPSDGFFVLPVLGAGTPSPKAGRLLFPYLFGPASGARIVGHINLYPDSDGVVRRVPLWIQAAGETIPALAWRAAALHLRTAIPPPLNSAFTWAGSTIAPDTAGCIRFHYPVRPGTIPVYSLRELLKGELPPEALADRTVFIGITAGENAEVYRTPVGEMSGVEVQAEIAAALLTGQTLVPVPRYFTVLLTLVATTLSAWVMVRIRPLFLLFFALLTTVGGVLGVLFVAFSRGWAVEPFFPIVGLLVASAATALWRSYDERRQRDRLARLLRGRAPPRLIAHLVETPDGEKLLNADVRFVVALFADVRGFVRLTEGQDPRMVQEAANIHLSLFTDAVVEAGGMVTKYVGDMIAVIFNAPIPVDRPVDQALRAAQEGQRRLKRLWRERPDLLRLPMGVGIHAGTAVVGLLGSSYHQEYDAIGDTVNVAARLSTYAPAGEIYVTEAVVASAGKGWTFDPLGVVQVRGRYEPVIAYRLREEG